MEALRQRIRAKEKAADIARALKGNMATGVEAPCGQPIDYTMAPTANLEHSAGTQPAHTAAGDVVASRDIERKRPLAEVEGAQGTSNKGPRSQPHP